MKAVLVHGFNVWDKGKATVDRLAPYLTAMGLQVDVDEGDYGYFGLLAIRLFQRKRRERVIQRLVEAFMDADIIITHSNGANFATQALNRLPVELRKTKLVIHISPALDVDTPIPEAVKKQLVFCTPHDFWVKLASYIPFDHPWGRMGARGFKGDDGRNINVKDQRVPGHSAWFWPPHIQRVVETIKAFIEEQTLCVSYS